MVARGIYEKLVNEEDARLCEDLDEQACRERPRSFLLILGAQFFTKLGDAVISPKTTLAWLTQVLGAPAFVLGFLVPLRESGSLVPQVFIGGVIRRLPVRKWAWVAGGVAQAACVAGIGVVAFTLTGRPAGLAILALIAAFSLARGFCSVAAKDVLGKTIPERRRGQLTGWAASAAGLVTVGVGGVLLLPVADRPDGSPLGWLFVGAGGLWLAGAAIYAQVPEFPGETGGGRGGVEALKRLGLLATDAPFRRFVFTRALLMCSALSAPFFVAIAQGDDGSPTGMLGLFVVASGVASLVSGPVWGRFADASSKRVMVAAALLTSSVGLATFGVDRLTPGLLATSWFLPVAYFFLSVAHGGVRVGRKTYVVDLATGNRRTDYVAVSNTVIGVLLLVVGSVGALTPLIGNAGVIGLLALMGLGGAALGSTLPETS